MRKKFVQTLAAQQLELSSHIRTHDMELEKEPPRAHQQRTTQSGSGSEDVIEIIDDDQEVELMMERHRKYHPRKYVNLQQPTSKVYYDKIDTTNMSPAPDKEDQDMEEEDDEKLMVIDCAKEGTQTKEPNNNSVTAPNGNGTMPHDRSNNGEPPGAVRHPSRANNAPTGRTQSDNHETPSSYNWHALQEGGHLGRKHPELRQHLLQQREKVLRSRTGPAALFMYQQQQQYAPPPYQRSQRSHPYDRRHTNDSFSTITTPNYGAPQPSDGRNTTTPHPRASQQQRSPTAAGIPAGISLGGAADGRKSAFSSPQDKRHRDATMMPPPTLPMPGSISSVAIAPRTPFYQHHHPYVQPPYHYPAYSANTPTASTYHTLEEWYRAGYPAPHLLSPTELQYYYHCYLSKIVMSSPGYHPHDPHYRDYPSLAMTPGAGTAYYPPPQYGFAKPGAVVADPTPHVAVPSSTAGGVVPTVPAVYPANQPIDFSQYTDRNVPTHGAGFLPTTVSSASTAATAITSPQQSACSTSYTTAPSTTLHYTASQSEAARPSVINRADSAAAPTAKGSPTAAHASSLMPPRPTTATMPQPQTPSTSTSLPSTAPSPAASLPSTMLSPSSMPSPTRHPPPPSMPSLSSTSHPPPTSTSATTSTLSASSMMPPPPTRNPPPPSMPSLTSTMPPPSSPSSASSTTRTKSDMPELPPPLPATSVLSGALRSERTDPRADLPPSVGKSDKNRGSNSTRSDTQSDYTSNSSEVPGVVKRTRRSTPNKPPPSRYEQCDPTPIQHTPKRRGRRPSVATYNKASSQTATTHSEAAAAQSHTNGERNISALLQQMRREMMSFLQQRRSDIISTMRIYTIGRMDFGGFLVEMKRHSVTYRDFMHVAFILMRRCGYSGFAMEPPAELDYRWKNPPQDFADYFAKNEQCNKQFVAENFDFLLLIVDNLLQQYCEPMEFFLLTYVLGLRPK